MAYMNETLPRSFWAPLQSAFDRAWTALTVSAAMEARLARVEALKAKTDEELADFGVRRENIVQYVFRDLMYC